jgi:hypothetical protein
MKWLQSLLLARPMLLRQVDQITEQVLDEAGAFCYSVRTRSVGWGARMSLFIYIQSDTITAKELELLRPWLTTLINRRLGTRLHEGQLYLQCRADIEWPQSSLDTLPASLDTHPARL